MFLLLVLLLMQNPGQGNKQQNAPQQKQEVAQPAPSPPVVNNLPSTEHRDYAYKNLAKSVPKFFDIYWPTLFLCIATFIAVRAALKTLGAIREQVTEMRSSGQQTEALIAEQVKQTEHMGKTVGEYARTADAMNSVAEQIAISAAAATASISAIQQQMRAYLCAMIGEAVPQDRTKNLRFQASVSILNAGLTPAYKVQFISNSAILPVPLPEDFPFPLPEKMIGGPVLGPRQAPFLIKGPIIEFVDDSEVEDIKNASGKALCIWGTVKYRDVFGQPQSTDFCQMYTFFPDGKVMGYYMEPHSDAT